MSAAIPASCHSRRRSPPFLSGSARATPTRSKPAARARSSRMRFASPAFIRLPFTIFPIVSAGLGVGEGGYTKSVYLPQRGEEPFIKEDHRGDIHRQSGYGRRGQDLRGAE